MTWVDCVVDSSYQIFTEYPYQIRKKKNNRIISEWMNKGYVKCKMNQIPYFKHIIIAKQFIPNPDELPYIDHINHIRSDNRIDNLRWINNQNNCKNKSIHRGVVYQFVDTISNDAIPVEFYGDHLVEDYYFYDDVFYFYNGINYRILHINYDKGAYKVCMTDTNGKSFACYFSKFKREHNLLT